MLLKYENFLSIGKEIIWRLVQLYTVMVLPTYLGISNAHADLGLVNLNIRATVVANSCTVSPDSTSKTVNMGTWTTKHFSAAPQNVPPVSFTINIERCGGSTSGVKAYFSGTPNKDDNTLLALNDDAGAATSLGIAILDKDKNRIPLGKFSSVYPITSNADSVPLVFYGQYVATGGQITAGTANADATFTLDYQ